MYSMLDLCYKNNLFWFFFFFLALYKIPKVLRNIEWNTRVEQIQATRDIKHFLCVCLWQWRDIHSEDDFDLRGS